MNIFDVAIILILIMGAITGFKRGFISEIVRSVGFFVVIILAYILKNPVSVLLYEHLPFFNLFGFIKGVTVLNVIIYEIIAFFIVLSLLTIILKLIIKLTNLIEFFIDLTVVLTPISKLGGLIVGLIESYIWVFIILYIISLPIFNIPELNGSKFRDKILNHTPICSNITNKSLSLINDFDSIKDKYKDNTNTEEFNKETLDLFLKYNIIKPDSADKLLKENKIKNVDEVIKKYKEEKA